MGADFSNTEFRGIASFKNARFFALAEFPGATFSKFADFENCYILGGCNFSYCNFLQRLTFRRAQFDVESIDEDLIVDRVLQSKKNRVRFKKIDFCDIVDFTACTFPSDPDLTSNAFLGTHFQDVADFTDAGVFWIGALNESIIEKSIIIDNLNERTSNEHFREKILHDALGNQEHLTALEGACRNLKNYYGSKRNEIAEQQYHRFQLITRQHRTDITAIERFSSRVYGAFSNYGSGLWSPILWYITAALALGGTYYGLACACVKELRPDALFNLNYEFHDGLFGAFHLSMLNMIKPFEIWRPSTANSDAWLTAFREGIGPGAWFWLQILCAIQSFFGIVLIFLLALTLRRRFQL